jgi:hypothetical protein
MKPGEASPQTPETRDQRTFFINGMTNTNAAPTAMTTIAAIPIRVNPRLALLPMIIINIATERQR